MAEWLTTEQVAEELQVPLPTVRGWRLKGTGPKGIRMGRHVRYSRLELDRWTNELWEAS